MPLHWKNVPILTTTAATTMKPHDSTPLISTNTTVPLNLRNSNYRTLRDKRRPTTAIVAIVGPCFAVFRREISRAAPCCTAQSRAQPVFCRFSVFSISPVFVFVRFRSDRYSIQPVLKLKDCKPALKLMERNPALKLNGSIA